MSTNMILPTKTSPQQVYSSYRVLKNAYDKWRYGAYEYNQYGLYYSDLYRDAHPEVGEAVRRLPDDVWQARVHRLHRAIQFSRSKIVLPEELWTKQEDPLHKYLEPYLQEVYKEKAEKAEWNKK